ncbi:hypothetical protein GTP38_09745 [Duganella sp. FT94W]|uniref:DUF2541 family protein n=1 Tax=Duganella lactea TaxID=2692173 RepID=A0ABW9V6P1_9BURK|nr:hypothetical protein [Duganella lactea]MYM34621.1 hypothetical protein [Duganella lactea]
MNVIHARLDRIRPRADILRTKGTGMRKLIRVALLLCCANALAGNAPEVNVLHLAGKSQTQVSNELKSSSKCKSGKYGISCVYSKDKIEIVFINGRADWITVNDLEHIPYDDAALLKLGLPKAQPTFKSAQVIRWSKMKGFREISIFKGRSGVDYAYIKVATQ